MRTIAMACLLTVGACGGSETRGLTPEDVGMLKTVNARIEADAATINSMHRRIEALEEKVNRLEIGVTVLESTTRQEVATFDPQDEQRYQSVSAPTGPVLLVLEKLEPYLDGFTVSIRIGNPSSATYSGLTAKVQWGRKYDGKKDAIHNKLEEKEIDLGDRLPPGSWTTVKFNIAPAKPEDVRRILFAPSFSKLSLRTQ